MHIIAKTSRLIIRQFLPDDEALYLELLTDDRLTAYLPKRDVEQNRQIFLDTLAEYAVGIRLTRFGVFSVVDGSFVGLAMLKQVVEEPTKSELGYVIHQAFKGTGIATEVSLALIKYGFEEMALEIIFAVTDQENTPSQKVLLKAGLVQGANMMRNNMELSYFELNKGAYFAAR